MTSLAFGNRWHVDIRRGENSIVLETNKTGDARRRPRYTTST